MIMYPPPFAIFNDTLTDSAESSSIILAVLIGTTLSFVALLTALGNIVVLLAFYCDTKLRTINDYFILNMAIADFLVGSFCIPFYIPFSLTQSWPFGKFFCKIWVTIDDMATMASVINIVAISINRYWSIAYPIVYRKYAKQKLVYLVMASVWILSFVNFAPGIWLIRFPSKESNATDCAGDYNHSFVYMLIAQFNYFIWPFVVLCVLNMLIMINIWKRSRKMSRMMTILPPMKVREERRSSSLIEHPAPVTSALDKPTRQFFVRDKAMPSRSVSSPTAYSMRSKNYSAVECDLETSRVNPFELTSSIRSPCRGYTQKRSRIIRDRKAARSLFILVLVFLIFLFPYVICATASTAGVNISTLVFEISFWLLWLNSTCNPFLYPFIQMKYRNAYWKLFQSCARPTYSF